MARGARTVCVTATVLTATPNVTRQPAVPSVRPASKALTVKTTLTNVSTALVTNRPPAAIALAHLNVCVTPASRSTMPLHVRVSPSIFIYDYL